MSKTLVKQMMDLPLRKALKLAAVGIISGSGVMGLPFSPTINLPFGPQAAIAQTDISNEEITQYARAVLAIDQYRTTAYTEIKDILLTVNMDIDEFDITCTDTQNLSNVPRSVRSEVREILTDYCNQSQSAVEENGLTARRFNEITEAHIESQTIFERIQQELIRLQEQ